MPCAPENGEVSGWGLGEDVVQGTRALGMLLRGDQTGPTSYLPLSFPPNPDHVWASFL